MNGIKIGFALCGSFCTFKSAVAQMIELIAEGADVTPIMSQTAYSTATRFGQPKEYNDLIESVCSKKIIHTITDAEPIGPKKMFDALIIEPCTGNTLAKLAAGITDTSVTMAAKSHLRNARPVVIAVSTNDALGNSAKNIGQLLNYKNIYFVPMKQDDCKNKPRSIVADYSYTIPAIKAALKGEQIQPIFV